jgi:hypothetical protein
VSWQSSLVSRFSPFDYFIIRLPEKFLWDLSHSIGGLTWGTRSIVVHDNQWVSGEMIFWNEKLLVPAGVKNFTPFELRAARFRAQEMLVQQSGARY